MLVKGLHVNEFTNCGEAGQCYPRSVAPMLMVVASVTRKKLINAPRMRLLVQRRVHADKACIHELKYRSDFAKKKIKKRKRSLSEQMYSLL